MEKIIRSIVSEIRKIDKENHTAWIKISDGSKDRYNTIIPVDSWKKNLKNFKKHPVLLSSHNYNELRNQIGKVLDYEFTDAFWVKAQYFVGQGNEEADWGWFLVEEGIAGYSVGFRPIKVEENPDQEGIEAIYKENELLEISQVLIPANANATQVKGIESPENEMEVAEILTRKLDDIKQDKENIEERPYKGEHACRLEDPKKYDSFARKNCYIKKDKKCIDIIFGIKDNKSEIQAMRFSMDIWSEADAKAYCKEKGGMFEAGVKKDVEPGIKEEDNMEELNKNILELIKATKEQTDLMREYLNKLKEPLDKSIDRKPETQETQSVEAEKILTKKDILELLHTTITDTIKQYFH